jgi:hypothetical protein
LEVVGGGCGGVPDDNRQSLEIGQLAHLRLQKEKTRPACEAKTGSSTTL